MSKLFSYIFFFLYITTFSQTTITGNISGMTFKPSGNPWIVLENVFVENECKIVIKPGCVFLFKSFTGIIVQGSMEVEGLPDAPVVFTSMNDTAYNEASTQNAEPFDWNGITIEKAAETVKMADFILSYSVYGIKSKRDDIELERGIFRQNGQFHFTINDKMQQVESNLPFNYNISKRAPKLHKATSGGWTKPVGISTLVSGTACFGTMGYFITTAIGYDKKYENSRNHSDITYYTRKRDNALQNALITGIAGGVLVSTGAGMLYLGRTIDKRGRQVALYPVIGNANGLEVVVKF